MANKKKTKIKDTSVTVTVAARNELEAIRFFQKQTKKLCLEEIIHEKFLSLPEYFRFSFMSNM